MSPLLRALPLVITLAASPACSRRTAPTDDAKPVEMKTSAAPATNLVAQGADIYEQNCATCHYDGSGSPVAPPLKGSPVVADSAKAVILTILKGQQGKAVVNGKSFNGIMPAQAYLSDTEIAAVAAFVRTQFGGATDSPTPEDVAALR
jgi:Cytochrome c, mono- and diheme variants